MQLQLRMRHARDIIIFKLIVPILDHRIFVLLVISPEPQVASSSPVIRKRDLISSSLLPFGFSHKFIEVCFHIVLHGGHVEVLLCPVLLVLSLFRGREAFVVGFDVWVEVEVFGAKTCGLPACVATRRRLLPGLWLGRRRWFIVDMIIVVISMSIPKPGCGGGELAMKRASCRALPFPL